MKRMLQTALVLLASTLSNALGASPLKRDEQVLFPTTLARTLADGRIEVTIDAWVHEVESRPGLTSLFARWLKLDLDAMSPDDRNLFRARTQLFRVDSERRKRLRVRFADGSEVALPATRADGRSSARAIVDASLVDTDGGIGFDLLMPDGDARKVYGRILHVPPRGLSVISDIDDTIRISNVRDRRELLLNTFARAFVAVPDMALRYRELGRDRATRFHYVSAAPLQLYAPIADFLREAGFPEGSVHLRGLTSMRALVAHAGGSRTHKLTTIRALLGDHPQRRFVLIGDSGELDPEIYAEIAREQPLRIVAIGIRDVTGEGREAPRYRTVFAGIDPALWNVFLLPSEWPLPAALARAE